MRTRPGTPRALRRAESGEAEKRDNDVGLEGVALVSLMLTPGRRSFMKSGSVIECWREISAPVTAWTFEGISSPARRSREARDADDLDRGQLELLRRVLRGILAEHDPARRARPRRRPDA